MGDYKNDAGSVNYNRYMGEANARNKTLRTPMAKKLIVVGETVPPVLGAPALNTSTNLGSQRGHGGKKFKA